MEEAIRILGALRDFQTVFPDLDIDLEAAIDVLEEFGEENLTYPELGKAFDKIWDVNK